jgi:hypothetical protein
MALPGGSLIKTLVYHFVLVSFFIVENAEICNLSHICSNMRASVLWSQSGYVSEGSSAQLQNILSLVTSSLGNQSTLPTCQFIIIKKASYSHCIKGCLELYVKLWPIIHIFKYQNLHSTIKGHIFNFPSSITKGISIIQFSILQRTSPYQTQSSRRFFLHHTLNRT